MSLAQSVVTGLASSTPVINTFVQYYAQTIGARTCSNTVAYATEQDSGSCSRTYLSNYQSLLVTCESDAADSPYTAQVWNDPTGSDHCGGSASVVQTFSGTGGECTYIPKIAMYVKVNCGSAPAAKDRAYYEGKFFNWLTQHKIAAKTGAHFVAMLQNFISNDKLIEAHNKLNSTYKLGHNQFSHMTVEEWRQHVNLGLLKKDPTTGNKLRAAPADTSALPATVDWSATGAVTPVKDQGSCGSCWAFSATGALEGAYKIKYGQLESFSEQNFVDCDTRANGGTDMGCKGGLMDSAFEWAKSWGGVCTEADYPYVSGNTKERGDCDTTCKRNANVAPKSYTDVPVNSDAALMSAIAQQPVAIAIQASQAAFQLYKSGVFTAACGADLDHGVLAVGYGTLDGTDYYKVKNSWGPTWGLDGYILLQRGVDQKEGQCGMLSGPPSYPNL